MAAIMGMPCAELETCLSSKHGVVTSQLQLPWTDCDFSETKQQHTYKAVQERESRAIPIPVSAPFHCVLMEPAALKSQETWMLWP